MALLDFSDAELMALREIARRVLGGSINAFGRGKTPADTWEDHQAPEVYIAKAPNGIGGFVVGDTGTGTGSYDEPESAMCDVHAISESDTIPDLRDIGLEQRVFNVGEEIDSDTWIVIVRDKFGHWLAIPLDAGLYRGELLGDHPGRGIPFVIQLGEWSKTTWRWTFTGDIVTAIDWFYSDPAITPDAGAAGWFRPMPSNDHGRIYVAVEIDCDSPSGNGTP